MERLGWEWELRGLADVRASHALEPESEEPLEEEWEEMIVLVGRQVHEQPLSYWSYWNLC